MHLTSNLKKKKLFNWCSYVNISTKNEGKFFQKVKNTNILTCYVSLTTKDKSKLKIIINPILCHFLIKEIKKLCIN